MCHIKRPVSCDTGLFSYMMGSMRKWNQACAIFLRLLAFLRVAAFFVVVLVDFFAVAALAVVFLPVAFLAVDFLAVLLREAAVLVVDFLAVALFAVALFAVAFFAVAFFAVDFLVGDFLVGDLVVGDLVADDFREVAGFLGALAPSSLASEIPIAIACFGLVTFLPVRPLFSFPSCISCITFFTFR